MRTSHLSAASQVLRVNVGFILKEGVGFTRDIEFDAPTLTVAADLAVSDFRGRVNFTRTPQGLYVKGRLKASIAAECVRCLEACTQTVSSRLDELFFYPPEVAPEGALTVGEDVHIDLGPLVREDMLLSVPMHALCRPDCKGLCPQCGQNWNEAPCTCKAETSDPRLAVLRRLLEDQPTNPDTE